MDRVSPFLQLIVDHLPHCHATVLSASGEVLSRSGPAVQPVHERLLLVDPMDRQVLVIHLP